MEVVKIDEKKRRRIRPCLAVAVVLALSRVHSLQLKSLKMFVFGGKISHLSFIGGAHGARDPLPHPTQAEQKVGQCAGAPQPPSRSFYIASTDVSIICFYATIVAAARPKAQPHL